AVGRALEEARVVLEQGRADDAVDALELVPRRHAEAHEEMQRSGIHPPVIARKEHDAGGIAIAKANFYRHRRGLAHADVLDHGRSRHHSRFAAAAAVATQERSSSLCRYTLPDGPRGSSSAKRMCFGVL